jgi:LPXTG-motif cell wall-anchored protein
MLPNLDISSTTINIVLMLVIFGIAFYVLKSKKKDEK